MIIQCQSCSSKYFLPEEKVPVSPLKVRCPKCRAVFMLSGRAERVSVAAAPAPSLAAEAAMPAMESPRLVRKFAGRDHDFPASPVATEPDPIEVPVMSKPAPVSSAIEEAPLAAPAEAMAPASAEPLAAPVSAVQEAAPAAPQAEPAPAAKGTSRGGKSADDRAKRLARVLVSDILWYNRERRDAALRDGTLMTSLGEEIKKSWELYKKRSGPKRRIRPITSKKH
jgi:predicted Zn finger-like uncharacterized protein